MSNFVDIHWYIFDCCFVRFPSPIRREVYYLWIPVKFFRDIKPPRRWLVRKDKVLHRKHKLSLSIFPKNGGVSSKLNKTTTFVKREECNVVRCRDKISFRVKLTKDANSIFSSKYVFVAVQVLSPQRYGHSHFNVRTECVQGLPRTGLVGECTVQSALHPWPDDSSAAVGKEGTPSGTRDGRITDLDKKIVEYFILAIEHCDGSARETCLRVHSRPTKILDIVHQGRVFPLAIDASG
mmetsp:Transcript_7770/g.22865  ORF Transcript_7770/g.22865 Transcript_7770/m.22865 type:complete len:237 (-) Transcript_7770:2967-3677(-)